ncbi:MAG: hypothetical protein HKN76_22345 [Saprospiraceae bacterium]|nr:hypothetical protein [Saprospiraceae bacterium]
MKRALDPYQPIDPDFLDIIDELIGRSGTINFFESGNDINDFKGEIKGYVRTYEGQFLVLNANRRIRLDKIITILGKVGPAYERYNHFSNVCFSCFDEGQF